MPHGARTGTAFLGVNPKVGKVPALKTHLLKDCKNIPDDVRKQIKCELAVEDSPKQLSNSLTPAPSFSESIPSEGPKRRGGEQAEFERDVCEWFVACGIPWNAANNPQTGLFSAKWFPKNVSVPDRRVLSGRILDGHVKKVEDRVEVSVKGKFATGQCDGWKNIAKTNVITTVMTVENEVSRIMPVCRSISEFLLT